MAGKFNDNRDLFQLTEAGADLYFSGETLGSTPVMNLILTAIQLGATEGSRGFTLAAHKQILRTTGFSSSSNDTTVESSVNEAISRGLVRKI